MEFEDIANLVNRVVIERKGRPLKDVERLVLEGAWHNQTYGAMADQAAGYTEDYLKKDVGPKLWRLLSDLIDHQGIKVTKRNIQNVLQHWAMQTLESGSAPDAEQTTGGGSFHGTSSGGVKQVWPPLEVWSSSRLDGSDFLGRQQELNQMRHWLQDETCRSVLIWGPPGVGKTALATKVLQSLEPTVKAAGYLRLTPGVRDDVFLTALVAWLQTDQTDPARPAHDPLSWVLQQLERYRWVLLIDQIEELFQPGQPAGSYRPGTESIQQFFQLVAEQLHQSSILWVSREKPMDLSQLRGGQIREFLLDDLSLEEVIDLLQGRGLQAEAPAWQMLYAGYGGNPLLLKGLAATVQEVYQGQVTAFLTAPQPVIPASFRDGLELALSRLPTEEYDVLYWLAIAHEPVPLTTLTAGMVTPPSPMAMQSLLGHGLCFPIIGADGEAACLDLNPIVRAIVLERLQSVLLQEILTNRFDLLNRLPLVMMTAQEAVQVRQRQSLLAPLQNSIRGHYPTEAELTEKCQLLHQALRRTCLGLPGYGAGNFIHLCQSWDINVSGADFADLSIWQSDLRHVSLQGANLNQAKFADTVFATALGRNPVMAFSQNGAYLAAGDQEGRLLLWELQQGRLVRVLDNGLAQGIRALAFSPGGDLLAAGTESGQTWLWSLKGSYHPDGLFEHEAVVQALAFSPDGSLLATGDAQGHLCIWDVASGVVQAYWPLHQGAILSLAFSEDGQSLVSGGDDQRACLWNLQQQTLQQEFHTSPTAQIKVVGFLADPQWPERPPRAMAAGDDEQSLTLWDIAAGRTHWAVPTHNRAILAIALHPNGQDLLCSYQDFSVALWSLVRRHIVYQLPTFNAPIWAITFSQDGALFATGGDYTIQLWERSRGTCIRSFRSQAYPVRCLAFTHDSSTLLTGHEDHTLRLWQLHGAPSFPSWPGQFTGHTAALREIAVSQDGRWFASGAEDSTIRLWQNPNRHCERVIASLPLPTCLLAFSPDSRWLASAGEEATIALWDIATGTRVGTLEGHDSLASSLIFSADSKSLLSGCRDGDIRLWDLPQGQCRQVLSGHQGRVHSLAINQTGELLASASHDGSLRWWQLTAAAALGCWHHPEGQWLQAVIIDPQDTILAVTNQAHAVEVWDVKTNQLRHQLKGHAQDIWRVIVSPDKTTLATVSQDDEIRIWRLDTGLCTQTLHPDRPYEGVNILGAEGLSEPEVTMLKALGAVVSYGG